MASASRADAIVALARAPIVRGAAWAVLAGLGIGFFLQMYARMARPTGNDLGARLASARILVEGGDPYTLTLPQGHGPYPLTIDALVVPLTWLPLGLAQSLWFGLSVVSLVGSLLILDRLWRQARGDGADPILAVPFDVRLAVLCLALFIPLQNHLRYGQLNLLLLCLCSLFLALHLRGRGFAAAAALGGAIALKLTPAAFLLYLGRGRWYRTAALAVGWTLLLAVGLPGAGVGQGPGPLPGRLGGGGGAALGRTRHLRLADAVHAGRGADRGLAPPRDRARPALRGGRGRPRPHPLGPAPSRA